MKHNNRSCFLKAGALLLGICALLLFCFCQGMLSYALSHPHDDYDETNEWQFMNSLYPDMESWADSIRTIHALRDSFILNDDGQRIHVYWLPAQHPTHRTALIIHGYGTNAIHMMHIGYMYHQALGYNIFLYDQYGHGMSDGDAIQMGWKDRFNAKACLHLIDKRDSIVVHGISMGAATAMMLSGDDDLPANVKAFVEDCGYTSVWDEFDMQAAEIVGFQVPDFALSCCSKLCEWHYGWNFKEASSIAQVKKCNRPMFFIHGEADGYVPTHMVHPLYAAHPGPKELWLAGGEGHARSYYHQPEEYTRRVRDFLDSYMR